VDEQTRPPLGIMPKYIWDSRRFQDLQYVIARYLEANQPIPPQWVDEFITLSLEYKKHNTKGTKQ
jgi:hypothetical protein